MNDGAKSAVSSWFRLQGPKLTEADVLAMCRTKLARFKVLKRVVFYRADDLPTTPTGKVTEVSARTTAPRLSPVLTVGTSSSRDAIPKGRVRTQP